MKRRNRNILAFCVVILIVVAIGIFLWFIYYGPDTTYVTKNKEARDYWHEYVNPLDMKQVRQFARRYGFNNDYYVVCDFSKPSGQNRFYIFDLSNGKRIMESYCMHGNGSGSTDSKPVFSNQPGSHASSIGLYALCGVGTKSFKNSIRLEGLDSTNSNARSRGILIHSSWKTFKFHGQSKYIPIGWESQGCFVVTPSVLFKLMILYKFHGRNKRILMWAYY